MSVLASWAFPINQYTYEELDNFKDFFEEVGFFADYSFDPWSLVVFFEISADVEDKDYLELLIEDWKEVYHIN